MVGIDQAVASLQVEDLVYLSGKNQAVAAHHHFFVDGRCNHFVEVYNLYQPATIHLVQPCFGYGFADKWIV